MSDLPRQEFLKDFLDESADHLHQVNDNLLALERISPADQQEAEAAGRKNETQPTAGVLKQVELVNSLFRSFHTLKGLTAMMGLQPAAELSHALETILRSIRDAEITPSPGIIDRLLLGTRLLERMIELVSSPDQIPPEVIAQAEAIIRLTGAQEPAGGQRQPNLPEEGEIIEKGSSEPRHRQGGAEVFPPSKFLAGLPDQVREAFKTQWSQQDDLRIQEAQVEGKHFSVAIFTPDPDKSAQGMNMNQVRSRLMEFADLLKVVPMIQASSIQFVFLLASRAPLNERDYPEVEWLTVRMAVPPLELPTSGIDLVSAPQTIRVDLKRLDDLMRLVGEMVVHRSRLVEALPEISLISSKTAETIRHTVTRMDRTLRELRQVTTRARMVPLAEAFNPMPLAVRELARASGKQVHLIVEGEENEIDRALVERLLDPLLHLVRNAITHGIETPEERVAAGKPPQGQITLRGRPQGEQLLISVIDDGQGISIGQIESKAKSLGWLEQGGQLGEADLLDIICQPGFSTRSQADLSSGRGLGMEIVRKTVSELGGSLYLHTEVGKGTRFDLLLPLSLTILSVLIVRCGVERFALPWRMIKEAMEIDPARITRLEGGELYAYRQKTVPLYRLADLMHLEPDASAHLTYGIMVEDGVQSWALVVDRLEGIRESVVRVIRDPLVAQPGIGGATELGDGSVILILDLPSIFSLVKRRAFARRSGG